MVTTESLNKSFWRWYLKSIRMSKLLRFSVHGFLFFSKSCLTNKLILGLNYSYDANYIFSISKFIGYIDVGDKCWRRNMLVITGFNRFCRRPRCCRHKDFVAFISNLSLRHNRQQHRHQHHRNTAQTQSLYPIFFCKQKQNFGCIAIFIARKLIWYYSNLMLKLERFVFQPVPFEFLS